MNDKINIYLDMDGVAVDWVKGALKILKREDLIGKIPRGISNISEATGIPMPQVWDRINDGGSEWWRNLDEMPWFEELYTSLNNIGKVTFLTSPGREPNSSKGKAEWLKDRFGRDYKEFIITAHKYHCAGSNKILIDDTLSKCQDFISAGGKAVMFPTDFNDLMWQFKDEHKVLNQANLLTYVIDKVVDNLRGI